MTADVRSGPADQIVLVQISDLHIGTSLMPSPAMFRGGARAGYNPHDVRLFRPLELALVDARRRVGLADSAPLDIIISGDLTQAGLDNDYATAFGLLHERWKWRFEPRVRWVGCGWPRERTFTVPGNHDHWRRAHAPNAFARGLAPDWFEATPWRHEFQSDSGALRLELFGVDSNSGFEDPNDPDRRNLFAGGSISDDEFDELASRLSAGAPESSQTVVRAIVCHHAFSNSGGFFDARPLSDASRAHLCALALRYHVAVVLTGHTHSFEARDWALARPPGGEARVLKELRCGTTLQGTKSEPGLQGFWLHQLARAPGSSGWQWTAWRYQVGGKFFDVDLHAPVRFAIPTVPLPPGA